jgi:excisionase family DNA binding protein
MGEEWLSLGDVAKLLGVHPGTVRLWSNKNILPVHFTSGGHRRYQRQEILAWLQNAGRQQSTEPETVMQMALKTVRVQIGGAHLDAEPWYQKLDEEARAQYRLSGRSLFQGLMNYLSTEGQDAENEAYAIGYEYASRAHRYGLNYVDATQAFLFFRNTLIESVVKVYRDANVRSDRTWQQLLERMHTFTDHILITLLETYRNMESSGRG